ncbi:hypothetical protein Tco_0845722 [Tanacetum coccineum]
MQKREASSKPTGTPAGKRGRPQGSTQHNMAVAAMADINPASILGPSLQVHSTFSETTKRAKRSPKSEEKPSHRSKSNPKRAKKEETVVPVVNEAEVDVNVVENDENEDVRFVGKAVPVPSDEARVKWPHRYETKAHVKRIPATNTKYQI